MKLGSAVIDYIATGYDVELWEFGNVQEIYDHLLRNGIIESYIPREKVTAWDAEARKRVNKKADGRVAVTPPVAATEWERSARALPVRREVAMQAKVSELCTRIDTITAIATAIKRLPSATDVERVRPELLKAAMMLMQRAVSNGISIEVLDESSVV